jgi:hydroxypyruvate reductase/glycerate 2-kinase
MFVKNKSSLIKLSRNTFEENILSSLIDVIEFILEQAQPKNLLSSFVSITEEKLEIKEDNYDFNSYENFYLISFGKASQTMSKWFLERFPKNFSRIIIVSPDDLIPELNDIVNLDFHKTGHPKPNQESLNAAENVVSLLENSSSKDLCLFLISGGGSSLLEYPDFGLTLDDYSRLVEIILSCGASISELNILRKHFSKIKGGKLAKISEASMIALVISDVIGNDLSTIASGPTVPDSTTWKNCGEIIAKYSLDSSLPDSIKSTLKKGLDGLIRDTSSSEEDFSHVRNYIVGDNLGLLELLSTKLKLNATSEIIDHRIQGEAKEIGDRFASVASTLFSNLRQERKKTRHYLLFGGETTVKLASLRGRGGRNQELALSFALSSKQKDSIYFFSLGTDGIDGNSDAAGALVGPFSISNKEQKLEAEKALAENDTNSFFRKYGGEIKTGYTGTNLMDVGVICIVFEED